MFGRNHKQPSRMVRGLLVGMGLVVAASATGCQVDVNGQTIPSPFYMTDDVQYFPAGPEFKLSREAAAMAAYQEEQRRQTP